MNCTPKLGGHWFSAGRQTMFVRMRGPWSQDGRAGGAFAMYAFPPTAWPRVSPCKDRSTLGEDENEPARSVNPTQKRMGERGGRGGGWAGPNPALNSWRSGEEPRSDKAARQLQTSWVLVHWAFVVRFKKNGALVILWELLWEKIKDAWGGGGPPRWRWW